jgi:hypothetical protein
MNRTLVAMAVAAAWMGARALPAAEPAKSNPQAPEPPHRSVSIDETRTQTGYTLDAMRLEADFIYYHSRFSDLPHPHIHDIGVDGDTFTAQLAFGVTDWLTARFILPIQHVDFDPGDSETGIGDIGLEGRVSLKKGRSPIGFVPGVDVSAGFLITLPTGDEDKGLGQEHATFRPYGSVSHWFTGWFGLHGYVFLEWQQGDKPHHGANAVAEFIPWSRELSLLAALEMHQWGTESPAVTIIPGAEYRLLAHHVSFGIGLPFGLSSKAEDWGLILNVQVGF